MEKVLVYCMCLLVSTALLHAAISTPPSMCLEIKKAIESIGQWANKTHPHSFHVPINVKEECKETALMCFRSQLPQLHAANVKKKAFNNLIRRAKLNSAHDHEKCTPCSNYTTQSPAEFLKEMNVLLQEIVANPKTPNSCRVNRRR